MANVSLNKFSAFKGKKFLVVDDFPEFRTAIKRMVEAFGATDVDTANCGDDAMHKLKAKKYDCILCDYNLGDGKDGQQVLEEGKHLGHVNEWQIFILLTAENTAEMVMGALEYEPDNYLVKPFNKEMVFSRLTKVMTKKADLAAIYKALQDKDPLSAIDQCDTFIAKGGKNVLPCLKIKGKQLLKLNKFKEAIKLYKPLCDTKMLPWVMMGLGQAYMQAEDYESARDQFQKIIDTNEKCVEAYDWLAKADLALGKDHEAQTTLEKAVLMSSKAILRQQILGDLAFKSQSIEIAEKSYRAAVHLGKHSCYRRYEDYVRYAEILIGKATDSEHGRVSLKSGNDAVVVLEQLCNLYRNEKKIVLEGNVWLGLAHHAVSRDDRAKTHIKKAIEMYEKEHVEVQPDILDKMIQCLELIGLKDKAAELKGKKG